MGKFLNADAFASTGQGLVGTNMFAYCNNNPINNVDETGSRCVAIKPLGGGVMDNPALTQEELSTGEKITILMFETASAVTDGIDAEVAIGVKVERAEGEKCERCWMYSTTVGESAEHPTLCERCRDNLI